MAAWRRFVFLRHGRSLADDEGKHEGRYDSPLTEAGEGQARDRSRRFDALGFGFDAIVSSPLRRALRTAEIVNEGRGLPLLVEAMLAERDNGVLAGLDRAEAALLYPEPAERSVFRRFPGPSGESAAMLQARAALALNRLAERTEAALLVVAHGGILNSLFRVVLGLGPQADGEGVLFALGDGGFVVIDYDETRRLWRFVRME